MKLLFRHVASSVPVATMAVVWLAIAPAARANPQLDRLADLVPPPRKHRHRYHGVFAPNHRLRKAITALAIGNVSKQREATTGGDGDDGRATGGCCDANPNHKPRSHDISLLKDSPSAGRPLRKCH